MSYQNANYSAFYVSEPFSESNLGANSTHDFVYYNMLRMWKGEDNSFPFNDAHDKTYNVRDGTTHHFSTQRLFYKLFFVYYVYIFSLVTLGTLCNTNE